MRKVFLLLIFGLNSYLIFPQSLSELLALKVAPELLSEIIKGKPELSNLESVSTALLNKNVVYKTEQGVFECVIRIKENSNIKNLPIQINSFSKNFAAARLTVDELIKLVEDQNIIYIYPGEVFYPTNDVAKGLIGANLVNLGYINNIEYSGKDVIVLVVDTGIDWKHKDFCEILDETKSRILFIWDQTDVRNTNTPEDRDDYNFSGLDYGVEYTQIEINDELDGTPTGVVLQTDANGHGTHVSGSACGNGANSENANYKYAGIAPEADIVFVKAGASSFSTVNLLNALEYAKGIANSTGKPVVVNMSLGGHGNAHDGTRDLDEKVDEFTSSGNGRVAVISAGNEGSSLIHISGTVNSGSEATISFSVPVYTPFAGIYNDYFLFDLWWNNDDDVSATVYTPNGYSHTQTAGTSGTGQTNDGYVYIYNSTDASHTNNDRRIQLQIYDGVEANPPTVGVWELKVQNNSANTMEYHGWLYSKTMNTSLVGANSQYTIGSPGTAISAITVGSYVSRWRWYASNNLNYSYGSPDRSDDISSFSSIGPTRDGRQKPDITAPGQAIISCTSSDASITASNIIDGHYHKNQGTSMASPVCAGAVALMLDYNPNLSVNQIKNYLTNSTSSDSYTGAELPNNSWGYGKLNVFNAIGNIYTGFETTYQESFNYDSWISTTEDNIAKFEKIAVRFTPTEDGQVTGVFFHPSSTVNLTGSISFNIYTDNSGFPGVLLSAGSTTVEPDEIHKYSWNYIDLSSQNISVSAGTDYHIVLSNDFGDDLYFQYENSSIDNRSSKYEQDLIRGYQWNSFTSGDFRLRPVVSTNKSALPVEMNSFTAELVGSKVELNWQTATELNNYGFEIQRSILSMKQFEEWEVVGFIQGHGNSNSTKVYSFTDKNPSLGKLKYRLKQLDTDGGFSYSNEIEVDITPPTEFTLMQNYPNPFNPVTTIRYSIPSIFGFEALTVKLKVFDVLGNEIATLVNEPKTPGNYEVKFETGKLSSGIYIYRLESKGMIQVRKMMLLK